MTATSPTLDPIPMTATAPTLDPIDTGGEDHPMTATAPTLDPIDAGLRIVLAAIEAWIARHALTVCPLPEQLGALVGAHAGAALHLDTRRWRGAGFAAFTVATIRAATGHLRSVTIIGLPAANALGPIVGVDLIGLGGALSLVAVDLAPTDVATWETDAAASLAELHAAVADSVVPRRWPDFASEVFSPRALIAGVRRGAEPGVLAAVASFIARIPTPPIDPTAGPAASERVSAWCRAELRNRREHDALTRLFGADPATAYTDLLFGPGAITTPAS